MVEVIGAVAGLAFVGIALLDAFETVVLPRRVQRQFRLTRFFFRSTWRPWVALAPRVPPSARETYLSFYGPLFLIILMALWATLMVTGFGLLGWGLGSAITASGEDAGLWDSLYFSGTTFFTLGIGDVRPDSTFSHVLTVIEGGAGFGFLALVITYIPVLYQSFSRREVNVSLLDARAGSPPSAGEFFRRMSAADRVESLNDELQDWERWAAELLETHLSYPVLALYRSQHERESWVAALTLILDVSALVVAGGAEGAQGNARLTFAMARHAAVDLSQVLGTGLDADIDRLSAADLDVLIGLGGGLLSGVRREELADLRRSYEPNVAAISDALRMPLPSWLPSDGRDAWESSPWGG